MSPLEIIAQIIGVIAIGVVIISFQFKNRRHIVFCQFFICLLFTVHYFLLGAYAGALINLIGIGRAHVCSQREKKDFKGNMWLYLFLFLFVTASVLTLDGDLDFTTWDINFRSLGTYISILTVGGVCCATCGLWSKNPLTVRALMLVQSPIWLIYDAYNGSVSGVINELIVSASIIVGIFRNDLKIENGRLVKRT